MYSTVINEMRKKLRLNSQQESILIGSVLGDGYLYPTVSGKYAYLRMCHGPKQENYLYWKYQYFRDWVLSPPRYQLQNKNKPHLGGYYWFKTIAHKKLLKVRKLFYASEGKGIPENIGELLNSNLSLAIWYMDDGCLHKGTIRLNTQSFTLEENKILQGVLRDNYQIDCKIYKSGGDGKGYILYIPKQSTKQLLFLTNKYVKEAMPYKTLTP